MSATPFTELTKGTLMAESQPTTAADHLERLLEAGVDTLIIGAADVTGEFRTKRFALDLMSKEDVEIAFSDYVFSADVAEELMIPRPGYSGYFPQASLGLPDIYVRPDWDQLRILPWDTSTALVLGDWYTPDGEEVPISPRGVLKKVIARLESMGLSPFAGCEFEFFMFRGDPEDVHADPSKLVPLHTGNAYGYGRGAAEESVLGTVRRMIDQAGIPMEAANPEAAPGQCEITIRYSDALQAADHAFLYKHFVRELLAREQITASFIAKTAKDGYGSSGHLHISLRDDSGQPLMTNDDDSLSSTMYGSIAGFLETLPEFISFYAPVVNSYRRFQSSYAFAGDTIAWGIDNRTCALRVIHAGRHGTRIETRTPGADINPYLALAAALAGIGHGIEQGLDAPPAVPGDAYVEEGVARVPNDLTAAVVELEKGKVARDWLGEEFVNFYLESRHWETEQHRLAVTDWEISRYL